MWLCYPSLMDYAVEWWRNGRPAYGTTMYTFSKLLQYVKYKLKRWNSQCFGNIFHAKMLAQTDLDSIIRRLREDGVTTELLQAEAQAVRNLEEWELREEIYWK